MGQFIFGNINKDGTIYPEPSDNDNFEVQHNNNKGIYTIKFKKPFTKVPTVITLQNFPEWNNFNSDGGNTFDNSVLIAVNREKCKVKVGNDLGKPDDRNFGFIAVGD